MPPDRAARVAEIVEDALERDVQERTEFLRESCGDDPDLRREVDALLAHEGTGRDFIETPAFKVDARALADGARMIGETVGDYHIVSLIGEGGMGEVYLATDTRLGRQVALKMVRAALASSRMVRHFRDEERILAALTHPNIARLYGSGITDDEVPFFVMEYVEGSRIDEFSKQRAISIRERLQLFLNVCAAVSYAHQRLVIHRDLKPANIRVTPEGEPKLLDFGIAKLLGTSESEALEETQTMGRLMTPEYASPEQIRGEKMTTASDVYSLGIILYELLTTEKPYRLKNRTADEISRAILEQPPTRPSVAAPTSRRLLVGDLDNIVLMAIRKEPERRYNSVAQFADDIRRYLSGLPVIAHRDTLGYRTVKFVGRNRIAVGAATAVVLALIGGILATAHEAQIARLQRAKAEQRFADVRKLANSFLFEIHDAIERLPGSTSARQLLVTRALEYLDKLSRDAQDDASLQRELVQAYIRVGNVQGNPTNSNLGDTTGALASYKKAAQLASKLATSDPQSRRPLALVEEKIADVLAVSGDIAGALRSAKTSLAIFERIAVSQPANAGAAQSLAISLIKVGDVSGNPNFANAGDAAAALSRYQESLAIWQAQEKVDPSNAKVRRFLGLVHERLGTILLSGNDKPSALEHLRLSSQIREGLAADFPADIEVLRDTAIAHEKIGDAFSQNGDLAAALESRSRSLAIFQRLVELDPQNVYLQLSLAISHQHMAELLAKPDAPNLERTAEGLQHCRIGIEILNSINADRANAKTRETVAELTSLAAKISP